MVKQEKDRTENLRKKNRDNRGHLNKNFIESINFIEVIYVQQSHRKYQDTWSLP